jgi:hypothetical protein
MAMAAMQGVMEPHQGCGGPRILARLDLINHLVQALLNISDELPGAQDHDAEPGESQKNPDESEHGSYSLGRVP